MVKLSLRYALVYAFAALSSVAFLADYPVPQAESAPPSRADERPCGSSARVLNL